MVTFNWQKSLDKKSSLALLVLFLVVFIQFERFLFLEWSAHSSARQAAVYLQRAQSMNNILIIEKSLLYQKALKSLRQASRLKPANAGYLAEYAQIVSEIGSVPELRDAVDSKSLGAKEQDKEGFYNLARLKYIEAISKEPANAIYHQRLADIYERLADVQNAESELKKAISLDPQNIILRLFLIQYFLSTDKAAEFNYHVERIQDLYRKTRGSDFPGEIEKFFKAIGRQDLIKK